MANIFSLYGSIFIDNQKANDSIDTTTKKAEGSGGKVKSAFGKIAKGAAAMGTAVIGGASAVAAGAMKIVNKTAAATDEVDKMSQKMGMTREGYQEWNYILSQSGMKIDSLKMGMKTMSQYMDSATKATSPAIEKFEKLGLNIEELGTGCYSVKELKDTYMDLVDKAMNGQGDERFAAQEALDSLGISFLDLQQKEPEKLFDKFVDGTEKAAAQTNKAKETFDKLGISVTDSSGKMKTQEQVFEEAVQALQKMEDGTEKARIAQDLFGRAGQELMPLLNGSAASVEELKQKAHDLGMVMSDETVDAGVKMTDTIDTLKRSGQGMFNQIGGAILPIVQKLFDALIQHMPQIQSAIQQVTPIITMLFSQLLPPLMDLASQIFPVLMQLLLSLLPPISQIISSVLPVITQLLQMLLPPIIQIVEMLLPVLLSLIQPLLPLLQPLLELLQPFIDLLLQLLAPLIDLINMILPPIIELFTTLLSSILPPLKAAFSGVAKVISGVFKTAFNAIKPIIDNVKKIFNGIIKFVTGVFSGDWDKAWDGIVDIFKGIINNIPAFFESVINGAIGLINGIISGINGVTGAVGIPEIPKIPEVKLPRLRIGMEYVPYDDFPALLHKGEQVLTASEAKEYRKNKGGTQSAGTQVVNNYTFHIDKFVAQKKEDMKEFIDYLESEIAMRTKKREAAQGNA